jgi:hypothetical protein
MGDEKWASFMKELRDRLTFRKLGIEVTKRKGTKQEFTEVVSFFPVAQQKKFVEQVDDNFQWPES